MIENRTGAAGNIGAEFVYRSAPDGYTLLSSPPPPLVINHNLYPKLGYDPAKFEPIIVMAHVPNALIVNPNNVKAASVAELIAHLRRIPSKVTAATQGNGTTSHLTAELFQLMAKVKLRHIPYRGSAPALQGLLAGDTDLMFDNLGVSLPLVEAGKLKLLAVASAQRMPSLPDVPTLSRNIARLRGGRVVRDRGAAENAAAHRGEDQRRRERGSASAGVAGPPQEALGGDFWRLGRAGDQIHAGGSRGSENASAPASRAADVRLQ